MTIKIIYSKITDITQQSDLSSTIKGPGLALSGGGYRATLFQLGILWRLNELGLLKPMKRITSVSGGSILNGQLGLAWKKLNFENNVATNFAIEVAIPIQNFCARTIDVKDFILGLINPFKSRAEYLESSYRKHLLGKATLQDLPSDDEGPRFIFCATNLQTGSNFRFSKPYIGDYRIGLYRNPTTMLAKCVAASSAFPPLFSPLELSLDPNKWDPETAGPAYKDALLREKLILADGGVYDNMGLQPLMNNYDPIIASSSGAPLLVEPKLNFFDRTTMRPVDISNEQGRALRRKWLVDEFINGKRRGTLWKINTKISAYELDDPIVGDSEVTAKMAEVPTRLKKFKKDVRGHLVNWGYVLCDTAIRKWVKPQPLGDWAWPVDEFPLPKGD